MPGPTRPITAVLALGSSILLLSAARTVAAARLIADGDWRLLLSWAVAVIAFTASAWGLVRSMSGVQVSMRRARLLPVGLAASCTAMFVLSIPAAEGPDELAHLQYTRFVAMTGRLPTAVPPVGDPWRADSYEWVQHPAYYIATGTIARLLGLADEPPRLPANEASRLHGGRQVAMYLHGPDTTRQAGIRLIWCIRLLHIGLAALTAWWLGTALRLAGLGERAALVGSASLGLVPQVAALMGYHSTDGAATAAATFAVVTILRAATTSGSRSSFIAGLATGLALAVKLSTAYLLTMIALATAWTRHGWRTAARQSAAAALGVCLSCAWVPLREWYAFGDPLGRAFRADVLAAAGLGPTPSPGLLDPAILGIWRVQVFEAFWARFGSLGAGPMSDSRLWSFYGAVSLVLAIACIVTLLRIVSSPQTHRLLGLATAGAVSACALWVYVTMVPRPYMAIHWTPRYVQPALPVLAIVATAGLAHVVRMRRGSTNTAAAMASLGIAVMAAAVLATARTVLLQFLGGY
ncbi:MAG: hypothetical protein IT182_01205 [Acidobacteria bacterium]|nr:hypothetical protein [Acidobacteriota bacterium]